MLAGAMETVQAIELGSLTRRQLEGFIIECRTAESVFAERRLRAMAALDQLGDGGLPSSAVLRSQAKVSERTAKRAAKTAGALQAMPEVQAQLASGLITEEHADAAVSAAERVGDAGLADAALAKNAHVPADLYGTRAREWADRNEAQAQVESRHRRQHRNRKVVFGRADTDGSFSLYATTNTTDGPELQAIIEAEADRLFHDDGGRDNPNRSRTDDQRRFDALQALIKRGAGVADGLPKSNRRPHPRYRGVVSISLADYLDPEQAAGELIGAGPLPRSVIQRMLCDGALAALIVDTDGRPLWLGREARTATSAQWTALVARDKGCVVCGAHPSRCEAHHIVFWEQGGPSDITNLVLLCARHHHDLHDHDLELVTHDGQWQLKPKPVANRRSTHPRRRRRTRAGPQPAARR